MTRVLVTGGAGFIGSNLVRLLLAEREDWQLVTLDKLTYAGNHFTLAGALEHPRHRLVVGDISDAVSVDALFAAGRFDLVLNLAAESHVDRSIAASADFVLTNVLGVQVLLDAARRHAVSRFVQISTDEVYGALGPTGTFTEESPLAPSSPYSSSKAAGDLLCGAWHRTYGMDIRVTRCTNNHGPFQFPEKLIPVVISRALAGLPVPVYGDGRQVRDWIHVEDHCRAILAVAEHGRAGRTYNAGANEEQSNLELVRRILARLGRSPDLVRFVADRPGHDWRYALDSTRLRDETGWAPRWSLEDGLAATIDWYRANEAWWRPITAR